MGEGELWGGKRGHRRQRGRGKSQLRVEGGIEKEGERGSERKAER